jgi:4-aminobutyrate aminotransferase-like enzyme
MINYDYYKNIIQRHLPKNFWSEDTATADIIIQKAYSTYLEDIQGKKYIDLTSQWSTNNVGNVHPEVLEAVIEGLKQYGFLIYGLNIHRPLLDLTVELLKIAPSTNLTRVAIELSGTGAVDAAVKFAIASKKRPHLISFLGQYHGYYTGTLNYGPQNADMRKHFETFIGGNTILLPYPYGYRAPKGMSAEEWGGFIIDYIEDYVIKYIAAEDRIAAILFEPIACESGVWIPPNSFIYGLRRITKKYGWFLIADEVMTGFGRTGKWFAIQHWGIDAEIVPLGKGMSGGLFPIAGVYGSDDAMAAEDVDYGTTFGGHPAGCLAAIANINVMKKERLVEMSLKLGEKALKFISDWPDKYEIVGDVRGKGLLIGIELVTDKKSKQRNIMAAVNVYREAIRNGVLPLMDRGDWTIRIQPPLNIEEDVLLYALEVLEQSIKKVDKDLKNT